MWFPSSNNVSVIYEWPATIPAQPPRYSTISSPYHNKLRPNSAGTHSHTEACVQGQCVNTVYAHVLLSVFTWLHVQYAQVRHTLFCMLCAKGTHSTYHLVGAWRLCLLAGLSCLIVLIVLKDRRRKKRGRWLVRWTDVWTRLKVRGQARIRRNWMGNGAFFHSFHWGETHVGLRLKMGAYFCSGWSSVESHKMANHKVNILTSGACHSGKIILPTFSKQNSAVFCLSVFLLTKLFSPF